MQASAVHREAERRAADNDEAARHRLHLTTDELQQLGMFRVAYLVGERSSDGFHVVIHSADGMTVAVTDTLEGAVELAGQLGLALVAVH
jgi:hypothetical protein